MRAIVNITAKRNRLSKLNGLTFEVAERSDSTLPLIDDNGVILDMMSGGVQFDEMPTLIQFDFNQIIIVDFQEEFQNAYDLMQHAEPKDVSENRCYYFRLLKYREINGIMFDPELIEVINN